jgi:hypothetical protein
MKRILCVAALILALTPLLAMAEELELKGECTLSYKGRIYAQGPCEAVVMDKKVTEIRGKVPENSVPYSAIISEEQRTGVLLGADTFVLADGELEKTSAGATYVWSNGYALETKLALGN